MMHPSLSVGLHAVAGGLRAGGVSTAFDRSRAASTALLLRVAANVIEHGAALACSEQHVLDRLIYAGTRHDEDGDDDTVGAFAVGGSEQTQPAAPDAAGCADEVLRRRLVGLLAEIPPERSDEFLLLVARSLGAHARERERLLLG